VPLLKQSDARYDIIIDDAPNSPNQKEVVWQTMSTLLPGIKDMIPPQVLLQLLEYSPLPASVVEKIKEVVKAPNPEQEMQKKMAAQAAILELQEKQAGIESDKAKIQSEAANRELDEKRLLIDHEKVVLDTSKMLSDRELKLLELGIKQKEDGSMVSAEDERHEMSMSAIQQLHEVVHGLAQMSSQPKRILRDENGQVIGVETGGVQRPVMRDENGQVVGLQ